MYYHSILPIWLHNQSLSEETTYLFPNRKSPNTIAKSLQPIIDNQLNEPRDGRGSGFGGPRYGLNNDKNSGKPLLVLCRNHPQDQQNHYKDHPGASLLIIYDGLYIFF